MRFLQKLQISLAPVHRENHRLVVRKQPPHQMIPPELIVIVSFLDEPNFFDVFFFESFFWIFFIFLSRSTTCFFMFYYFINPVMKIRGYNALEARQLFRSVSFFLTEGRMILVMRLALMITANMKGRGCLWFPPARVA